MDAENLVQMANRIAEFFEAMPDRAEAVEGVTQHIRRYWEPRMRAQLMASFADAAPTGLHSLVAEALRTRGDVVLPRPAAVAAGAAVHDGRDRRDHG